MVIFDWYVPAVDFMRFEDRFNKIEGGKMRQVHLKMILQPDYMIL